MLQTELLTLLSKYRLRPDKRLGQHYLIDQSVLAKIIDAAEVQPDELILEIGAGPGTLTKELAKAGGDVLAVEYDRDFCKLLQEEFNNWRNVHILVDDALRLDLATLERDGRPYQKIVANIPYQITNPLVRKILSPGSPIKVAVLLVQKEVADRLMAPPHSSKRGLLTVMADLYATIEPVTDVPAIAFYPPPKVESTVIKITRKSTPVIAEPINEPGFFWLVKQGFSGKRKILINSLAASLRLPKEQATAIVEEAVIDVSARAEDLSIEDWFRLYKIYSQMANVQGGNNVETL